MDPTFGDILATQVYKACFKHVYKKDVQTYSEKDEGRFEQCLSSYAESYRTVSTSFIEFIEKLPKKGLTLE